MSQHVKSITMNYHITSKNMFYEDILNNNSSNFRFNITLMTTVINNESINNYQVTIKNTLEALNTDILGMKYQHSILT